MKNHIHTSISRPLIIAFVPFEWLVFELLTGVLLINWFHMPLTVLALTIAIHIWAMFKTVKDHQWAKILVIRLRFFEKTGRDKKYIA